jgi:hypothetical protein
VDSLTIARDPERVALQRPERVALQRPERVALQRPERVALRRPERVALRRPGKVALHSALALAIVAIAHVANAQTVIVRSAPPGAAIEVSLDGGRAAAATADTFGDATLAVASTSAERSVHFHVDSCGNTVRVFVVSRGLQAPAADAGCTRADLPSVFDMRSTTTFVIDMNGPATSLHVTQGRVPVEWVWRGPGPPRGAGVSWGTPQKGLTLSGAVGFSAFSNAADVACGNATDCRKNNLGIALAAGADFWFTRFAAASIGYLRPADVTVNGSGTSFTFDSRVQARILMIGGKAGASVGPARIYAIGGINRHQATITVNETLGGATQSSGQQTQGWNWVLGGGVEGWVKEWAAVYGEFVVPKIQGSPIGGGEGGIDDRATSAIIGARIRIGR